MTDGIDLSAFSPPVTVAALHATRCGIVSEQPGVYVVTRYDRVEPPALLDVSAAGWFKGRDPSYAPAVVRANWVPGARIIYIGMTRCKKGLKGRIRQLVRFAHGDAVAHRGGRMLWHLADWRDLEVRWVGLDAGDPAALETALIESFRQQHGARPFANMVK